MSKNLHNIKKVVLLWHWDCGGYGGSNAFDNNIEKEEETYQKDLRTVKSMLSDDLPEDIQIIMAYSKRSSQGLDYFVLD